MIHDELAAIRSRHSDAICLGLWLDESKTDPAWCRIDDPCAVCLMTAYMKQIHALRAERDKANEELEAIRSGALAVENTVESSAATGAVATKARVLIGVDCDSLEGAGKAAAMMMTYARTRLGASVVMLGQGVAKIDAPQSPTNDAPTEPDPTPGQGGAPSL